MVGYGLDGEEQYRNLPHIARLGWAVPSCRAAPADLPAEPNTSILCSTTTRTASMPRPMICRYFLEKTALITLNFNPAVSYRVTDWLSVGGGFSIVGVTFSNEAAINNVDPALGDGKLELKSGTVGFGGNVGVLVEPWRGTRFGVAYRTPVKLITQVRAPAAATRSSDSPRSTPCSSRSIPDKPPLGPAAPAGCGVRAWGPDGLTAWERGGREGGARARRGVMMSGRSDRVPPSWPRHRSGHQRQEQERREDHEVHRALHQVRAAARQRDRADQERERQ